jgi:hypothetical protein
LRCSPALKVLDLGKNRLYDVSDLFRLAQRRKIVNLNLGGNTKLNAIEGYKDRVLASCPQVYYFPFLVSPPPFFSYLNRRG